jgi:predicted Rossmann-fold nucleotide-binding protein
MGTLDELFEMLTWNNLKIHNKKVFILNIDGYYDALIQLLENMDTNGFMYDNWKDRIIVCSSIEALKPLLS